MTIPLRVLMLEDSASDAELELTLLAEAGYACQWERVETRDEFLSHLQTAAYDLILADHNLPHFDGLTALALVRAQGVDLPFILISGALGEELAIESLQAGATDYVLKTRLERLVPVVHRALREQEEQRRRRQAEEALHESEDRYRSFFDHSLDACLITAPDGSILAANPAACQMFGRTEEEICRLGRYGIVDPTDPQLPVLVAERTSTGQVRGELLFLRGDGTKFSAEFSSAIFQDRYGRERTSTFIHDITERKRAEEALQAKTEEVRVMSQQLWQAAKLATMGELAASIAHELNNPLTTISLRIESLLEQLSAHDAKRRTLQIVGQEVERMGTLVANLLHFSRRSTQQISTLDVRKEIGNTLELIEYHLRNHQITVVQEFASDVPLVQADRQQVRQLLLNLFTNASDAMPQGGTLTIRVKTAKPHVVIEVADTGVGITAADLPKVLEPFFTTKPEGKGTGLGLAICRRIAQEHHGTFALTSEGPGKGATVHITLPGKDEPNTAFAKDS